MLPNVSTKAAKLCSAAALAGTLLTSGCAETIVVGDAGCATYGEFRLQRPQEPLPRGAWGFWVADLDDGMTGACR